MAMVRKQLYLSARHNAMLKRLAHQRGATEAEVVRQALDLAVTATGPAPSDLAWGRALAFMQRLANQRPLPPQARDWTRDDLYAERLERDERNSS